MGDDGKLCQECRAEHGKLYELIRSVEKAFDERLDEERDRLTKKLDDIAREVRTYILQNIGEMRELILKTDALHKRMDEHVEIHKDIEDQFEKLDQDAKDKEKTAREESKIIKSKKHDWWWGIVASLVVNALGWILLLLWVGFKFVVGGGLP